MEGKVFKQRYRLVAKLGSGRLADAYAADDLQMNRQVVVKVLFGTISSDPAYVQRMEAEARVAAELEHPHIARTLDWGREDELSFVVTEYVKGRSLGEFLSSEGMFPPERAARIAEEVCEALQLIHSRSLVHGGISAGNIFIDEIGQVKLMDVGMAWTATGRGTPQYISPEQAQGLAVDARTDIYSLGIVLYQMLTGGVPFDAPDNDTVINMQANELPKAPSVIEPSIPPGLDALVMKALTKNPSFRFQNASEMHDELLRFTESRSTPAPTPSPTPAPAPVAKKKRSKAWAWVAGVLAVLIVVGIVLAIVLTSGGVGSVTVPNIVGMDENTARQTLEDAGLKMQVEDEYITNESQQVGVVAEQAPAAGTELEKDKSVTAKVTAELRMPNVVGETSSSAESILKKQGISTIVVSNVPVLASDQVGKVVTQDPRGGALISPGTSVTLEVGEEVETIAVPDVEGLVQATAESRLEAVGFVVTVQEQADPEVPAGQVISQSPPAGQQAERGSTVTIVVSTGPPAI